jgi:hypothetical protein
MVYVSDTAHKKGEKDAVFQTVRIKSGRMVYVVDTAHK